MMTREEIDALGKEKPKTREVKVPGWPKPALIRVMSGTDRDSFEAGNYVTTAAAGQMKVTYSTANIRARLAVRCLCDDTGRRLYTDNEAGVFGAQHDGVALDAIYDAARDLNCLTTKAEDDLAKKLEASPSSEAGSESPPISE